MKGIRAFIESDIDQVAELQNAVFAHPRPMTPALQAAYREWLKESFLHHPSRRAGLEPLVYEHDGQVVGFLGVTAREFSLREKTYSATLSSNFVVSPKHRGTTGVALYSAYLNLTRDFAYVDEVLEGTRELHERLGMALSPAQSVRWVLPLRPIRRVTALAATRLPGIARTPSLLAADLMDSAARSLPRSPFKISSPPLERRPIDAGELAHLTRTFGGPDLLRPSDACTEWLVARARGMSRHGDLMLTGVYDSSGRTVGWYVYYAQKNGQNEVLQLMATRRQAGHVLDCLAYDAFKRGAVSIAGVLHPWFLAALAERRAVFEPLTRWMLLKSKFPEITDAFLKGNLLLSRLDGEWCQHAE